MARDLYRSGLSLGGLHAHTPSTAKLSLVSGLRLAFALRFRFAACGVLARATELRLAALAWSKAPR